MSQPLTPDVGTRVSFALSEARTVLGRAETALYWLDVAPRGSVPAHDPDHSAIVEAITAAIEALAPFRRTGRANKSHSVPKADTSGWTRSGVYMGDH